MELTKDEKKLLSSENPDQYIDLSVKLKISRGRKAFLSRIWQENTGYTVEDIMFARNRHPYWKEKKQKNHKERTKKRLLEHNYSPGLRIEWTDDLIEKFLELNKKKNNGRYEIEDRVLAKEFKTTIPGIQHMRRKMNYVVKILDMEDKKVTRKRIMDLIKHSEGILYRMHRDLSIRVKK